MWSSILQVVFGILFVLFLLLDIWDTKKFWSDRRYHRQSTGEYALSLLTCLFMVYSLGSLFIRSFASENSTVLWKLGILAAAVPLLNIIIKKNRCFIFRLYALLFGSYCKVYINAIPVWLFIYSPFGSYWGVEYRQYVVHLSTHGLLLFPFDSKENLSSFVLQNLDTTDKSGDSMINSCTRCYSATDEAYDVPLWLGSVKSTRWFCSDCTEELAEDIIKEHPTLSYKDAVSRII